MRRLLLFEFIQADAVTYEQAPSGVRCEARAMLQALLDDAAELQAADVAVLVCEPALAALTRLPTGVSVLSCREGGSALDLLAKSAHEFDFVLPVAPEWDRILLRIAEMLEPLPCCTLLPSLALLATCSDKMQTWNVFHSATIPMLPCRRVNDQSIAVRRFEMDSVFKPRFGAGCEGIQRGRLPSGADPADYIRQRWIGGPSLSTGLLGSGVAVRPLPVAEQVIVWQDHIPHYEGSRLPAAISPEVETQVRQISEQVIRRTGDFQGYIGLDFLLSDPDGTVFLNEINPRVCTSYVNYRRSLNFNPLAVMIGEATVSDQSEHSGSRGGPTDLPTDRSAGDRNIAG